MLVGQQVVGWWTRGACCACTERLGARAELHWWECSGGEVSCARFRTQESVAHNVEGSGDGLLY